MAYQVAILNFEGPLDLLLQLIERSDLKVTEISLGEVTNQYLSYIEQLEQLDPAELNRFLELAARLAYIKSLALLQEHGEEQADELADLSSQLEQYAKYKSAAQTLLKLLQAPRTSFEKPAAPIQVRELPISNIDRDLLSQAYQQALKRLPINQTLSDQPGISLDEAIQKLRHRLSTNNKLPIAELWNDADDRATVIVYFLALLELIKQRLARFEQAGQFGHIYLSNG